MRSVRDMLEHVLPSNATEDERLTFFELPGRHEFWQNLYRLGAKKATKESSECDDIYATAPLTDAEWDELLTEFKAL